MQRMVKDVDIQNILITPDKELNILYTKRLYTSLYKSYIRP